MTSTKTPPKKLTRGNEVADWIETHCRHTAAEWYGQPFHLLPWQRKLLRELFTVDRATGRRQHRWAYVSVPKKNGKTEMLAAIALWCLVASGEPSPLVVCAAGSDDQADVLFTAARTMVEESPTLRQVCECYEAEITVPSIPGSRLVRVAASARKHSSVLDGKNVYVAIVDELHCWEGEKGELVWGTITRSTGARREPLVLQISTAGYDKESICYRQYEIAKKVLADPLSNPRFYAHIVEAPEDADYRDPAVWEAANPSYGTTVHREYFEDAIAIQPENEFRRYHMNVWTRSAECWLPPGAWEACRGDVVIDATTPTVVGVDMALKHDSVAVVWCQLHDGVAHVRSRVWNPQGDRIDIEAIEGHVRTLHRELNVVEVVYDPAYFERSAQVLLDQGVPMVEFPQSPSRMVPACQGAYEAIVQQRVVHDGDPTLADHVLSAAQRESERGWTLSKGRSKRKIDAVIALVIALHEAAQPPEPTSIYEVRGLIVI